MDFILLILILVNIVFSFYIFSHLVIEKKRNRILQAFIAGIIRSISDYYSKTDVHNSEYIPRKNETLPISYGKMLDSIEYEFGKDFWAEPYQKWLKNDRSLFLDNKYANDGFVFIYYDLFDKLIKEYNSEVSLSKKEISHLQESVVISKENIDELRGEIAMYEELLDGKLDISNFKKETLDNQLLFMFAHIKKEHRDKIKQQILSKL